MLLNVPPLAEINAALSKARALADQRNLENFDAVVSELRAENQFIPDDLSEIRDRLFTGKLDPVKAHWLLIAPHDRPPLETFREMVSTRLAAARKSN